MPATSPKQQRFFGAELGRRRAGKAPQVDMPTSKVREMAKGLRNYKGKSHG